jgi:hypothetical protein
MAGRLRARAVGIMKQLDAGTSAYRALIEKELAARIAHKAGVPPPGKADVPARGAAAPPAGACACGTQNDRDARFCKSCGTKLRMA